MIFGACEKATLPMATLPMATYSIVEHLDVLEQIGTFARRAASRPALDKHRSINALAETINGLCRCVRTRGTPPVESQFRGGGDINDERRARDST